MGLVWVDSGGVRLAVYVDEAGGGGEGAGQRPTVLLVHGYPDNASVWDGVVRELAGRFRVVRYDVRGCGRSGAPDGVDGYRMSALVGDLVRVVEATGGGPVHLVAHDWGSIQAWAAVAERGELFSSFTSVSGPDLGHVGVWVREGRRGDVFRQMVHSWYIGAFQVPVLPEVIWRVPMLLRRFHAQYRDARNGVQLYRANMVQRVSSAGARRVSVPVQQLALLRDPYVTPAILEAADAWCERLWRRPIVGSHWVVRDRPAVVARAVSEFVEFVSGGVAARELGRARVGEDGPALRGRLALVTGAGSGIGRATALALAEQGALVLCADLDFDAASRTAGDVGGSAFHVDVADLEAVERLGQVVLDEFGVVDLVVANAGVAVAGKFLDTTGEEWRRVVDVNLLGVVHTLQAFLPGMVERGEGGHVVVTSSAAGFLPLPSLPAYGATKAGVLALAQSLAGELEPHGISVNAVCPGFVHTDITRRARFAGTSPEEEQRRRDRATELYRRRGFGPEKVAAEIVAAVGGRRQVVVPVTPEAKVGAIGVRVAPRLTRRVLAWLDRLTQRG